MNLEKAKENQEKFRSHLNKKKWGKWKRISEEQKNAMNNLKVFYKAREKVINCLIIILQFLLMVNMKQNMEKDSKY